MGRMGVESWPEAEGHPPITSRHAPAGRAVRRIITSGNSVQNTRAKYRNSPLLRHFQEALGLSDLKVVPPTHNYVALPVTSPFFACLVSKVRV